MRNNRWVSGLLRDFGKFLVLFRSYYSQLPTGIPVGNSVGANSLLFVLKFKF
jgi:hypothetical protein